ncbi:DUF4376 domain-containing protein [Vibrio sp. M260112]|uniref:DUF4376 domain-containing protein n=1 Tax=Vibrio sp. M260112 TaxID=3020895 RepID=UPI002F40446B
MRYWTLNNKSLEVIGCGDADKWNIPRNVLLIEPLPAREGFALVAKADLSGTEYIEDHRGKTIYSTAKPSESKQVKKLGEIEEGWTLKEYLPYSIWQNNDWIQQVELLQVAKRNEINQWRDTQEANPDEVVAVNGIEWDANPSARSRIESTLNSGYLPPFWTDANDVDQPISIDVLKAIHAAIVQRGFEIHTRQRQMKAEIKQIINFETLEAYKVGW